MIHTFTLVGRIRRIAVSGSNRQANANGGQEATGAESNGAANKGPSAVLTIQYGPRRDPTNRAVEFVNAVSVRVPSYKWPMLADKLKDDMLVEIQGRIQGVFRMNPDMARLAGKQDGQGRMDIELVAERVMPLNMSEAPYAEAATPASE